MAYMTNGELNILKKLLNELYNCSIVSPETIVEYSELVESFEADKIKRNKKTWEQIKERRKTDKNYGRTKNKNNE